jgi:hypothetical protein
MPWGQKAKGKRKKAKGGREKRKAEGKRQKEKTWRIEAHFRLFPFAFTLSKGRLSDEWVPKQKSQGGTWFPRCAPWDESVIAENDRPLKAPGY